MKLKILLPVALVSAGLGGIIAVLLFVWVVGGDATPSGELAAPTLDINALPTLDPVTASTQIAALSAEVAALQATIQAEGSTSGEPATAVPASDNQAGRKLFRIVQEESLVTFTLMEDLMGERATVVGSTDQVAGDIIVDFANPSASQLGMIRINARTLATSNENRNRALRSRILRTAEDQFEYIVFTPARLNGLPDAVAIGDTAQFEIVGDLRILNTSRPVTFNAEVTLDSETQISGSASVIILYADWGIVIPDAIGVANVTDEVTLAIEFIAAVVDS